MIDDVEEYIRSTIFTGFGEPGNPLEGCGTGHDDDCEDCDEDDDDEFEDDGFEDDSFDYCEPDEDDDAFNEDDDPYTEDDYVEYS